jgi:hypothetical protein
VVGLIAGESGKANNVSCVVDPSGKGTGASQGPEIDKIFSIPKKMDRA